MQKSGLSVTESCVKIMKTYSSSIVAFVSSESLVLESRKPIFSDSRNLKQATLKSKSAAEWATSKNNVCALLYSVKFLIFSIPAVDVRVVIQVVHVSSSTRYQRSSTDRWCTVWTPRETPLFARPRTASSSFRPSMEKLSFRWVDGWHCKRILFTGVIYKSATDLPQLDMPIIHGDISLPLCFDSLSLNIFFIFVSPVQHIWSGQRQSCWSSGWHSPSRRRHPCQCSTRADRLAHIVCERTQSSVRRVQEESAHG